MFDEDVSKQLAAHSARNAELLEHFRVQGHSLEERQPVEHHFWADSQQAAAMLARELYQRGYLILKIAPTNDPGVWNVEAGISRTFADAASEAVTQELVQLAASTHAVYDGWGASVPERSIEADG